MTTASKITLVRVVLIPVYMVLMLLSAGGAEWLRWAAVAVFIIASVSDFLDGYIARHYNQVSDFGKFLDPLADKLLVTACMMIFVGWGRMPSWLVFIVIAREFAISGLRMVAEIQSRIMDDYNESCIGTTMQVLCEGYDPDEESYYGRTFADSPDIDGKIWFTAEKHIKTGDFADVRVVDAYDGELVGVLEEEYNDDCE